ncbi:endonuclease III [Lactococcus hodotermopsidis]|uniref:Endonuclease III n=1 Tax=Pseudolactococcus hodotermopsidis TaxID=2709157 RepID=A0A6A0BAW1_9LACT|nr:endonuclease III [Lactococcus hodotermopsidis]GFH41793.1 endonuclease III [Lactococcus hodotermopsidis]
MLSKANFLKILDIIAEMFPRAHGELRSDTPFQMLIAVILSAQATDKGVNKATPALFAKYPDSKSLALADISDVESLIKTIGLYHSKAKNIIRTAEMLETDFGGELPHDKDLLQKLPGVGRKTANVVLGDAFGIPGIAVDTHVERVSKRLQLVKQSATVTEVEDKLMKVVPESEWVVTHHRLIFFGRYHCTARSPKCTLCPVLPYCKFGEKLSIQ